ncbi:MAG: hypothetical protein ACLP5E_28220 [Streptosporangiaceae bacterium]
MDTTDAIDPTEVMDAAGELDAAPALELFPYPGLSMALAASAYELAKQLLTWEVTSTYDFAEKLIKCQRSSTEKVTAATAR